MSTLLQTVRPKVSHLPSLTFWFVRLLVQADRSVAMSLSTQEIHKHGEHTASPVVVKPTIQFPDWYETV
jgi:hypothetical protein